MGDTPCECGRSSFDPVTGFCVNCDPVIYRVIGLPNGYFREGDQEPPVVRFSARRKLGETVARVIAQTGRGVEVYVDEG